MKLVLKDSYKFKRDGLQGWAYNSKEDFENASAAYIEVSKRHGKTKTTKSDRIYFIIDGDGEFIINNETFEVEKSDVIIIPKNTPYDFYAKNGILKLFLVHTPAFDPSYDVKLNK